MNITFIGMGIMGVRMAANILRAGHNLTVFNRTPNKAVPLAKEGAELAKSLPKSVEKADMIITILSNPDAVKDLAYGENGILQNAPINTVWIDSTTVNPSFSEKMVIDAADHQILYMDAPVAGSKIPAEKGTLTFFVGGAEAVFNKIKPVLLTMGSKAIYAGESGMGSSYKLIVNLMLAQAMASYAEAIQLGKALNVPPEFLMDMLPDLPVAAPFLKIKSARIRENDFSPEFPLEHMLKDLQMVSQTAYEKNVPLPISLSTKALYAMAVSRGMGRKDFSAISDYFEKNKKVN